MVFFKVQMQYITHFSSKMANMSLISPVFGQIQANMSQILTKIGKWPKINKAVMCSILPRNERFQAKL